MLQSLTSVIKLNSREHEINCRQQSSHFLFMVSSKLNKNIYRNIKEGFSEHFQSIVGMAIIRLVLAVMQPEIAYKTNRKGVKLVKLKSIEIRGSMVSFSMVLPTDPLSISLLIVGGDFSVVPRSSDL